MGHNKEDVIVMIAAGMLKKKKEFMNSNFESMYLNYGLLGLATILYDKGYKNVKMFQGDYKHPLAVFEELKECNIEVSNIHFPVFVSVPSFFSVQWAADFIKELKRLNKNISVILGGRWVVDRNKEWIKQHIPEVDFISCGCPDEIIDKLLYKGNWTKYNKIVSAKSNFKHFNYSLLHDFLKYQPQIEVSRGCPMGCEFCLEKNYNICSMKEPEEVIEEIHETIEQYGTPDLNFYFEATMFNPTVEWAEKFCRFYQEKDMKFHWRFESRVDTLNIDAMRILSNAGLKVIDLGLESASVKQLLRMNKSTNPQVYLEKASILIKELNLVNIWVKLNILLYLGENKQTIEETMQWLDEHSKYIKGVSVNPFIFYLDGKNTEKYVERIIELTGIEADLELLHEQGYLNVDLSEEITFAVAKDYSNYIASRYMSEDDFIDLKRICYLRRY